MTRLLSLSGCLVLGWGLQPLPQDRLVYRAELFPDSPWERLLDTGEPHVEDELLGMLDAPIGPLKRYSIYTWELDEDIDRGMVKLGAALVDMGGELRVTCEYDDESRISRVDYFSMGEHTGLEEWAWGPAGVLSKRVGLSDSPYAYTELYDRKPGLDSFELTRVGLDGSVLWRERRTLREVEGAMEVLIESLVPQPRVEQIVKYRLKSDERVGGVEVFDGGHVLTHRLVFGTSDVRLYGAKEGSNRLVGRYLFDNGGLLKRYERYSDRSSKLEWAREYFSLEGGAYRIRGRAFELGDGADEGLDLVSREHDAYFDEAGQLELVVVGELGSDARPLRRQRPQRWRFDSHGNWIVHWDGGVRTNVRHIEYREE